MYRRDAMPKPPNFLKLKINNRKQYLCTLKFKFDNYLLSNQRIKIFQTKLTCYESFIFIKKLKQLIDNQSVITIFNFQISIFN